MRNRLIQLQSSDVLPNSTFFLYSGVIQPKLTCVIGYRVLQIGYICFYMLSWIRHMFNCINFLMHCFSFRRSEKMYENETSERKKTINNRNSIINSHNESNVGPQG